MWFLVVGGGGGFGVERGVDDVDDDDAAAATAAAAAPTADDHDVAATAAVLPAHTITRRTAFASSTLPSRCKSLASSCGKQMPRSKRRQSATRPRTRSRPALTPSEGFLASSPRCHHPSHPRSQTAFPRPRPQRARDQSSPRQSSAQSRPSSPAARGRS